MAADWATLTVDEIKAPGARSIAIGPFGSRMKADTYVPSGVPVIRGTNISDTRAFSGDFVFVSEDLADSLRSCNVHADDLVFPHRGAIGEVAIVPADGFERYMLSTSLMKLTCDKQRVDPRFVFYFFRSEAGRHALLQNASTVGTPGIGQPLTSLRSIKIPVPPLPEQRRIAHILGTLDDKIELNRRMNEALEEMARALFKSWFVDFDPVRAKVEGRESGLPKHLADLFPDRLVGSELGEIPGGWEPGTIAAIATLNPESWKASTLPEHVEYVDLASTKWGEIYETAGYSRQDAPSRARRVLRPGDTIVGTVRPGNGAFAYITADGLTGSTGFAVVRPSRSDDRALCYIAATNKEAIDALAHLADGGAYPAVRPEVVLNLPLAVSPLEVRNAFNLICSPWLDKAARNRDQMKTLAHTRTHLLAMFLSDVA